MNKKMFLNLISVKTVGQIRNFCKCNVGLVNKKVVVKNILFSRSQVPVYTSFRTVSSNNSQITESAINVKDSADENKDSLHEVYRGSVAHLMYKVKVFSLSTSVFSLAAQPYVIQRAIDTGTSPALLISVCTVLGFFTFVTPILLHLMVKKYIVSVKYCPETDTYTAITYSFFLRKKEDKFKVDEVIVPDIPGLLTNLKVKNTPYFIDKDSFVDVSHYKKLMGFDKPIDFQLGKQNK